MTAEKSEPLIFKSIKKKENRSNLSRRHSNSVGFTPNSLEGLKDLGEAKVPAPPPRKVVREPARDAGTGHLGVTIHIVL